MGLAYYGGEERRVYGPEHSNFDGNTEEMIGMHLMFGDANGEVHAISSVYPLRSAW